MANKDDKRAKTHLIRNSTAEFLIFTSQSGGDGIEVRYENQSIWLKQKLIATLFSVTVPTISEHLANVYDQGELDREATVRKLRTVQTEGSREVVRNIDFFNLDAIIPVGYRVNSTRAIQFRQWATQVLRETTWEHEPDGKILKPDESVAKNYPHPEELDSLGRVVNAYLELAEERAKRRIPMTMEDWVKRLDVFLGMDDREILRDSGKVSAKLAKEFDESEFEKYRIVQDRLFESDFDREVKRLKDE